MRDWKMDCSEEQCGRGWPFWYLFMWLFIIIFFRNNCWSVVVRGNGTANMKMQSSYSGWIQMITKMAFWTHLLLHHCCNWYRPAIIAMITHVWCGTEIQCWMQYVVWLTLIKRTHGAWFQLTQHRIRIALERFPVAVAGALLWHLDGNTQHLAQKSVKFLKSNIDSKVDFDPHQSFRQNESNIFSSHSIVLCKTCAAHWRLSPSPHLASPSLYIPPHTGSALSSTGWPFQPCLCPRWILSPPLVPLKLDCIFFSLSLSLSLPSYQPRKEMAKMSN